MLSQDPLATADLSVNWGHLYSPQAPRGNGLSLRSCQDCFCKPGQSGDWQHAGQRDGLNTQFSVSNNHWQ